jgi:hypothetical protein
MKARHVYIKEDLSSWLAGSEKATREDSIDGPPECAAYSACDVRLVYQAGLYNVCNIHKLALCEERSSAAELQKPDVHPSKSKVWPA